MNGTRTKAYLPLPRGCTRMSAAKAAPACWPVYGLVEQPQRPSQERELSVARVLGLTSLLDEKQTPSY